MTQPAPETALRALDLFERLLAYPGNARFRGRLLKRESDTVLAELARIEAGHAARGAMPTEFPETLSSAAAAPPERIGPFRLTEQIGQGGMGDVWRGERDDGLFEQTVAIKLIQSHLSASAASAFEAERRILAKLDHPDIVRLTDGGVTDAGLPYLIMDYVEGVPFDRAVAALPLDQRIRLFIQAASTVQFAHSRLVAHADLKPSNIIVDQEGRVRLLDFGIAGLLEGEEARPPSGAMTREYASPQRIAGAPPSIADDVYALGRMLGLITAPLFGLSNVSPFGLSLSKPPADPTSPFDKLRANGRLGDADLVAVIAKATAEEEADRYDTVAALIADLGKWQDGLPVSAHRDSFAYRTHKFIARHKLGVAASVLAILALLGTTFYAVVSANRAERARAESDRRFGEVRSMAKFMLFDLYDQVSNISGTTKPRATMAQVGQRYLTSLAASRDAPMDVRIEAAEGFVRVAQIMGVSGVPNLSDTGQSIKNLNLAAKMLREMLVIEPQNETVRILGGRVAELQCQMKIYGDHDAELALLIAEQGERQVGAALMQGPFNESLWRLRQCHGDALTWLNRTKEAVPLLKAELDKALAVRARDPSKVDDLNLIRNYRFLGEAHLYDSNRPEAMHVLAKGYDSVVRIYERDTNSVRYLGALTNIADTLSVTLSESGQPRDSLRVSKRAYEIALAAHNRDYSDINSLKSALSLSRIVASGQAELGQHKAAQSLMADTEARWLGLTRRFPDQAATYRLYALSMRPHGDIYRKSGNLQQACAYYRRAAQTWAAFEKRWGASPSDKTEEIAYAAQNVSACEGNGQFRDG
jgi:eukaryotic-like serine/threonine-protein kinase